ncbi:MAG: hypothetical protein OXE82_07765 [Rhodobacter sp.]|nr:hypothetical protein [Rhodobacter sp.]
MRQVIFPVLLSVPLCGCDQFPQLDAAITDDGRNAEYPELVPSKHLRAAVDEQRPTEPEDDILMERVQRLRERGKTLEEMADRDI